jgi:acyl-CoA thioesterase I
MKLRFALISFALVLLTSCFTDNSESKTETELDPVNLRFLALGDSYTIGQGVSPQERWPEQLVDSLGWQVDSLLVLARTGWTTSNLLGAVSEIDPKSFDLVTLLIGVNNQYRGLGLEFFTAEFDSLLQLSILYAGSKDRVITISIPDWGYTPFGASRQEGVSRDINVYNEYIETKSKEMGVSHVNITEISRSELGTLAPDDLHPSADQYALWVKELMPVVREKFK